MSDSLDTSEREALDIVVHMTKPAPVTCESAKLQTSHRLFEAWAARIYNDVGRALPGILRCGVEVDTPIDYVEPAVQDAWMGWQAREALTTTGLQLPDTPR